jgi:hypothetical protein
MLCLYCIAQNHSIWSQLAETSSAFCHLGLDDFFKMLAGDSTQSLHSGNIFFAECFKMLAGASTSFLFVHFLECRSTHQFPQVQ